MHDLDFCRQLKVVRRCAYFVSNRTPRSSRYLNPKFIRTFGGCLVHFERLTGAGSTLCRVWNINRADLFLAIKKHSDFPKDTDSIRMKKYQEMVQEGERFRRRYKQRGFKHWSGSSLRDRCETVGLLSHYEIVVHEYSSYAHSDPVSSQTTLSGFTRYGGFACGYKGEGKKETKEYEWAVRNAFKFQLLLWLIFSKALKIGLQKKVTNAVGKLKQAKEWSDCFQKNRVLCG